MILRLVVLFILWGGGEISAAEYCDSTNRLFSQDTMVVGADIGGDPDSSYRIRTTDGDFLDTFRKDAAFDYNVLPEQQLGLWRKFLAWLNRHDLGLGDWSGGGEFWDILLWFVALSLFVFLLYKLVWHNRFLFRSRKGERFLAGNFPEENLSDTESYPEWLEKAKNAGDYGLAVRILYLSTLRLLDEKKLICWDAHKTNQSYLLEIQDAGNRMKFRELSRIFDCVCYGEFEIGESVFRQVESRFNTFQKEIGYAD